MKISLATIREPIAALGSRSFSDEKGHDLSFEAGLLYVRHNGALWLIPASNVLHMRAADEPKKR